MKKYKNLKNLNLLYVEDDKNIADEVRDILQFHIDNIYYARNGKEGLELFKKKK